MKALTEERLFQPFMDDIDGVLCIAAENNAAAVAHQATPLGWRFPLWLDPELSLRDQVRSSSFAPASSRFGPYCDNITGMNWLRPDGKTVRVGERVVKSTTGYDLLRFLLESGERYGRPTDYVLRLRPLCNGTRVWRLDGDRASLSRAVATMLRSSWIHWLESLDAMVGEQTSLRVAVHCPDAEGEVFEEYLSGVAKAHGLTIAALTVSALPTDGLPDFVVKTTVDRALETAFDLARNSGVTCVVLCSRGVVLGYVSDRASIVSMMQPLEDAIQSTGGDWQSRHVDRLAVAPESGWMEVLSTEWGVEA